MNNLRSLFLAILLSCILINKAISQQIAPPDVLQYLKDKINIFYLNDPNTATPSFYNIPTSTIMSNTNGVIFGRGGNNGMSRSAVILLSLFKNRTQSPGDGRLQDFVYKLLKLRDKSIDIILINDQLHDIDPSNFAQYGGVDTFSINRSIKIWPTIALPNSNGSAGTIIVGEKVFRAFVSLQSSKNVLIDLISKISISDYNPVHLAWIFSNVPPGTDPPHLFNTSLMDSRLKTNQGICNAIRFALDTAEMKRAIEWYEQKASLVEWHSSPNNSKGVMEVPSKFWFYDQLKSDDMLNRGFPITSPPFNPRKVGKYYWIHFGTGGARLLNHEICKYRARDEIMIGLLGYAYIRCISFTKFLDAIKLDNDKLLNAVPEKRLAILIENLCLSRLNGRTLREVTVTPPSVKQYLIGIALFDFFSDYGSGGDVREFNRWFLEGSISQELGDAYNQVRASVMSATSAVANQGLPAQIDAIKTALNITTVDVN